ncbi:MAG: hypothetical protein EA383_11225 [Spirochaetaceae bacterium]|nr:MAG: hypothetical protein EA383_11225 [Spirochaetaceae bacterium]
MPTSFAEKTDEDLLERLMPSMRRADPQAYENGVRMQRSLRLLSDAFHSYPSVFAEEVSIYGNRSLETLVEALFRDGSRHSVLLPTKVAVGKGLMIARINTYGFLLKICDSSQALAEYHSALQHQWEFLIFSLLIENVYQTIVESTDRYTAAQRRLAAIDLLHLWEHRSDRNVPDYAPVILDLWRVRKRVAPVFGTMLGTRELLRISSLLESTWYSFLQEYGDDTETIQALEEFIFGLSFEQISRIRAEMDEQEITAVDRDDLVRLFGSDALGAEIENADPREMYRFYQRRAQEVTRRIISGRPGPRRTLEEILLVYLLDRNSKETIVASAGRTSR